MFSRLLPRQGRFFDLFNEHAEQIVLGSHELAALMANHDDLERRTYNIESIEKRADKITRATIELVHKTFITPLDREDIHQLISKMDDVLDLIARDAVAVGAKQVVLPANDTAGIRRRSRWLCEHVADPVVYLTGIGPLGGTIAESFAAAEGVPVRRAVVGRRICSAVDPRQAAESVVAELEPFR